MAARGTDAAVPRFLADESCDFGVVRALRAAGFDVVAVVEKAPGALDERVIELAKNCMTAPVFVDANVLIYERDPGELSKQRRAREIEQRHRFSRGSAGRRGLRRCDGLKPLYARRAGVRCGVRGHPGCEAPPPPPWPAEALN
ncbi:MAG: hypothetical protein A3F74_04595 [Betaproteobacteria bacterium RIFCSPLOWO2_12_FULL_62_58]|nr:MAG: hypothetical protein A3F74_04595 [Betaproteobacteria bacterium RIFCSPLOWO2_12_FULL_62_58]